MRYQSSTPLTSTLPSTALHDVRHTTSRSQRSKVIVVGSASAAKKSRRKLSPSGHDRFGSRRLPQRQLGRALGQRVGVEAHAPRSERLQPVPLQLRLLAALDVAHAEVERQPVVELQQRVVLVPLPRLAAELPLLLRDEGVNLLLRLGGPGQPEAGVEPVALLVDAGPVHRDEQAGVGVLLGDRRDPGAVEGEVRADVDVDEVDGLASLVHAGRTLPDSPAVVVALGRDHQRVVTGPLLRPLARELPGEVGVVGLENDLPRVAAVADDHRTRAPASSSRRASASSTGTTSPYFASMS